MTVFDGLAETGGDDEFKAWLSKMIDAKAGDFGEFDKWLKGSFNLSLVVKFEDVKEVIRFPKPGHTATCLRDEKVRNEIHVLEMLKEKTTIPVPRVLSWGTTAESLQQLGPFILMEYIEGVSLTTLLKQPTETDQDEVILATEVDDARLDYVYEQLAGYLLQLSHLSFNAIGALSRDSASEEWTVHSRPLAYNQNELQTVVSSYPSTNFPTSAFISAREYLQNLADEHLIHLHTQRNLANTRDDAKKRFIARHRFKQLVDKYCSDDTGPFKLFCDDLQPSNMLADPETFRITAVLDWEFTNVMPAQFSYDPPWWLLLLGPDMWLEEHSMEEFMVRYVPRMEQFLRALERVEANTSDIARSEADGGSERCLSLKMRESWSSKKFWFDYGIRKSFDIDAVYWDALHEGEADEKFLEQKGMREEMERFVDMKMEQLGLYRDEYRKRFSSG
ncbi:phosphotransferase enzyme family protein-like protein [Byssothecium circinans]|uniref:Phosphotransferase enzyme family protein-like protein n=1 Tax=Byssothecium circinans TaxID=147558 RepID=A0A6A5UA48_9PLEO|nr:phosphotransferase enzyme family protein-like protein [Byssothecium circinans]